jgi:hypothetical protein
MYTPEVSCENRVSRRIDVDDVVVGEQHLNEVMLSVSELASLRRFNELLLRALPAGVGRDRSRLSVDERRQQSERILRTDMSGRTGLFTHAAHGISPAIRCLAIDTSFRERKMFLCCLN